ncbi:DUF1501 domain-containing protein [Aureivirga marina]|uniref:DUF1501 domain-containing protein n=1 Tax=Aureivirga marina TaxID=1182451 RepID=UPI0018CAAED5|nr:DUF1501 domain-containing protein [Aureivirga marina]
MKRRDFLKTTGVASVTMLLPNFLKALEFSPSLTGHKKLVIIQLSGGNDGLNTVIPYENDIYYKNRPTIGIGKNEVLKITDELGLHPSMKGMEKLFEKGYVSILNNIGYPNPNRSHFRAMDIWHTASDSNKYLDSGWLGRYLDSNCQSSHEVLEIDTTLSLALKGDAKNALALKNPNSLYQLTKEHYFDSLIRNTSDEMLSEDNLGYLYKTLVETKSSAKYIFNTSKTYESKTEFPKTDIGQKLETTAELINSGLDTSVYYISTSGFDTHVFQEKQQEKLLGNYSDAMLSFVEELKKGNNFKDTLIVTFSEFGRRLSENGSRGTDHGTAGPMFVISENLKKNGIFNEAPDLINLDGNKDIKYHLDFRQVYATVLDKWLEVDSSKILNSNFQHLNFI